MFEPHSDLNYIDEDQLRDLGIEPVLVRILCPWAVEYTGHDGRRCWAVADLTTLLQGGCP